ncbi:MAG: GNAT family N-acetyltransferase, partial [Candidatus Cloacimonadaceae bacterium]|nr:GNAT family N-acetyltransferase [Candidatus Cloacimonadaceae bacterium]
GSIVGFVSGGKNRSQEGCESGLASACDGELAAMYLLKAYHRRGIGRALTEVFSERLRSLGYRSMVAWVAEKNPATGFYQRMGGELIDRRILIVCEESVPVIAYRYILN